jgi:uncharacterized protein (UPF0332 family)
MRKAPTPRGVQVLLEIARREISDASLEGISEDGRFEHAYDAIRSLAEVALLAKGYFVPKGGNKHERLIDSLRFTLGEPLLDKEKVDYFDRCRRMRHKTMYERSGLIGEAGANTILHEAQNLLEQVDGWLQAERPDLVQPE